MQTNSYFSDNLFRFLRSLKKNNDRTWFEAHRAEYEQFVRAPMLEFLEDFKPRFEKLAPKYICDPKPRGGSMFRIYRDMRFVDPDEGPFKTHVSAQFRHRRGKDVHAPGFYLHLEPGSCFFAGGLWRPPTAARNRVHAAIANNPKQWLKIKTAKSFAPYFAKEEGKMLKKPSAAWKDSLPESIRSDLMRNDFLFSADFDSEIVTSPKFMGEIIKLTKQTAAFMDFLAVGME